eukprot:Amastigsp_a341260_20.p1 type:complete len:499 gc:universal Amastigsp_a341260_20:80-1576(+)
MPRRHLVALAMVLALACAAQAQDGACLSDAQATFEQVHLLTESDGAWLRVNFVWKGVSGLARPAVRFVRALSGAEETSTEVTESVITENGYCGRTYTCTIRTRALSSYRVGDLASGRWSQDFAVRGAAGLAAAPVQASASDSGPDELWFAVVGDIDVRPASFDLVAKMARDPTPFTLAVVPGDLSYARPEPLRWDRWGRMFEIFGASVPTLVCPGNHEFDYQPLAEAFLARFPKPATARGTALYWTTRVGPIRWIVLTSGTDGMPEPTRSIMPYSAIREPQLRWLREELTSANTAAARAAAPWLVVLLHQPLLSSGIHQPEPELTADLRPLFESHAVDLVLSGHNHGFEVSRPNGRNERVLGVDPGTVYVVAGTGGFGRHTLPAQLPPWAAAQDNEQYFGYLRAHATRSQLRVDFVPLYSTPSDALDPRVQWDFAKTRAGFTLSRTPPPSEGSWAAVSSWAVVLYALFLLGFVALPLWLYCRANASPPSPARYHRVAI